MKKDYYRHALKLEKKKNKKLKSQMNELFDDVEQLTSVLKVVTENHTKLFNRTQAITALIRNHYGFDADLLEIALENLRWMAKKNYLGGNKPF